MSFTRKAKPSGVSVATDDHAVENERAAKVRKHLDGSDLPAAYTDKEALMSILPSDADRNPEPRGTLFEASPRIQPPDRGHWFVDSTDYPGFCAACSLPRTNRNHVERAA